MPILNTTDNYGVAKEFQYDVDDEYDRIIFRVYELPVNPQRFYSHTFEKRRVNLLVSTMMTVNNCNEFRMQGIPEAVLRLASGLYGVEINSSSIQMQAGNFMTPQSIRVWERLAVILPQRVTRNQIHFILIS